MIDKTTARQIVADYIGRTQSIPETPIIILDEETIEKPYGWIFFYTSQQFYETDDVSYALAGNGPIVVEKADGSVHQLGTAEPEEVTIRAYEAQRGGAA